MGKVHRVYQLVEQEDVFIQTRDSWFAKRQQWDRVYKATVDARKLRRVTQAELNWIKKTECRLYGAHQAAKGPVKALSRESYVDVVAKGRAEQRGVKKGRR